MIGLTGVDICIILKKGQKILKIDNYFVKQAQGIQDQNLVANGNQQNKHIHKNLIVNSALSMIFQKWKISQSARKDLVKALKKNKVPQYIISITGHYN